MKAAALLRAVALGALLAGAPARAVDLRARSESGGKQFVVYSEDVRLRQRVASFAEEVKTEVLQVLGESDFWRAPIVITLARAKTEEAGEPPARLRLAETQPGFKVEIQVKIGDDPAAVNLQKMLLRAVLLEFSYRPTGIKAGQPVVEPPWWVVEGLIERSRRREQGSNSALFARLVETNKLPQIEEFLAGKPDELGPTAGSIDRALAMCLLEMLAGQPGGRADLGRLLRDWPQSNGDPAALLARNFPALGSGRILQKWWTLSVARFAAQDRYQGLTAEETEKALGKLLRFEIPTKTAGEKKLFGVADYAEFLKLPGSRDVLTSRHAEIVALGARANALYRAVLVDYEDIFLRLSGGKARGLRERLAKAEDYHRLVVQRTAQITDYLNWFEATQMPSSSGLFDNYLKTAEELAEQERRDRIPIARYLDDLEKEL